MQQLHLDLAPCLNPIQSNSDVETGQKSLHVEFINSITEFPQNKGNYYCISFGAEVEGSFRSRSNGQVTLFLRQYEPNIDAHFTVIRRALHDYAEAMRTFNLPK